MIYIREKIIILLSVLLIGCSNSKYKYINMVDGIVTNKEHIQNQYNIEIKYDKFTTTIDNQYLYNNIEVNDIVKVDHFISESGEEKIDITAK